LRLEKPLREYTGEFFRIPNGISYKNNLDFITDFFFVVHPERYETDLWLLYCSDYPRGNSCGQIYLTDHADWNVIVMTNRIRSRLGWM
jgi:hypothetical protein